MQLVWWTSRLLSCCCPDKFFLRLSFSCCGLRTHNYEYDVYRWSRPAVRKSVLQPHIQRRTQCPSIPARNRIRSLRSNYERNLPLHRRENRPLHLQHHRTRQCNLHQQTATVALLHLLAAQHPQYLHGRGEEHDHRAAGRDHKRCAI